MTDDEKPQLNTKYPLFGATKEMLGIIPGSPIHPSEYENIYVGLYAEVMLMMRLLGR